MKSSVCIKAAQKLRKPCKTLPAVFITNNKEKIYIARQALGPLGLVFKVKALTCPEIQSDNVRAIAAAGAKFCAARLGRIAIKTDVGLFIETLGGFPGPYANYVERTLAPRHILAMMSGARSRRACYREALAVCEPSQEPIVFECFTKGAIALKEGGDFGLPFDRIFIHKGDNVPMACFGDDERLPKYNNSNWFALARYLDGRNKPRKTGGKN
ncbi:MAG: hypothetical protein HY747_02320 [Elusimicrobia bacterium]|nr:hypothetical protein [Elusimicrobiota bacterium]